MPHELTEQQARFCEAYAETPNGAQAAIAAGYAKGSAKITASRLLTNANVKARIAELRSEQQRRTAITADWVIERLVQNADRAMQAVPVLDNQGMPTGEYKYEGSVANRALELIGKHYGMFTDKLKIEVVDVTELSDEDLLAITSAQGVGRGGEAGPD